mgnify:FL=1
MRIKDLAQGMLWPMRVHPRLLAKPSPITNHAQRGHHEHGHAYSWNRVDEDHYGKPTQSGADEGAQPG